MTTFKDGPAKGQTLMLRRAQMFLRVVQDPKGTWDALDQPDDTPKPEERLYAYRIDGQPAMAHYCIRGGRGGLCDDMHWDPEHTDQDDCEPDCEPDDFMKEPELNDYGIIALLGQFRDALVAERVAFAESQQAEARQKAASGEVIRIRKELGRQAKIKGRSLAAVHGDFAYVVKLPPVGYEDYAADVDAIQICKPR